MSLVKYRDVADMPRFVRDASTPLDQRIAAVWARAQLRGPPSWPLGVQRFRSLGEAQAARIAYRKALLASR